MIDGSVQSRGGELRVDLGLSDANTRRQLRAESISGQPSDFKGFQERIVNAALSMLELELHAGPSQATTSSDAFVAFTCGLGYFSKTAPENADSAIFQLTRALQLDPGYAEAYAWMGRAYGRKYELTKDKQWVSKLSDACDQSLKLRPDLVEGHICKGILHNTTGRYQDAASDFLLALDADPTNDDAYQHLSSAPSHSTAMASPTSRRLARPPKRFDPSLAGLLRACLPSALSGLDFLRSRRWRGQRHMHSRKRWGGAKAWTRS